jgi:hypothetical protein
MQPLFLSITRDAQLHRERDGRLVACLGEFVAVGASEMEARRALYYAILEDAERGGEGRVKNEDEEPPSP